MKLAEMSPLYEDSARRIQVRMEELRLRLRTAEDPDSVRCLRQRLTELQPMLRQCPPAGAADRTLLRQE